MRHADMSNVLDGLSGGLTRALCCLGLGRGFDCSRWPSGGRAMTPNWRVYRLVEIIYLAVKREEENADIGNF